MRCEHVDCKHVHRNIITDKFYGRLRNPSEPQRTSLPQNVSYRQLSFVIVLFVPSLILANIGSNFRTVPDDHVSDLFNVMQWSQAYYNQLVRFGTLAMVSSSAIPTESSEDPDKPDEDQDSIAVRTSLGTLGRPSGMPRLMGSNSTMASNSENLSGTLSEVEVELREDWFLRAVEQILLDEPIMFLDSMEMMALINPGNTDAHSIHGCSAWQLSWSALYSVRRLLLL
jgi:hypothetical protein